MMTGAAKIRDVAEHLSLHPETVRRMVREGAFRDAYKIGAAHCAQVRIPWPAVYEYEQLQPRAAG